MKTAIWSFTITYLLIGLFIYSMPANAITPPPEDQIEALRNDPDLQKKIDFNESLLAPLLNKSILRPADVADTFRDGVALHFGETSDDPNYIGRYDANKDGVIDERDFIEVTFQAPALVRTAATSPTEGQANHAVLLIKFPDVAPAANHDSGFFTNMFWGNGTNTTKSYYWQVSDNSLTIGGQVLTNPDEPDGYFIADYPKTTYGGDMSLLEETLNKADVYYDFNDFDFDNNGEADGVYFIYAGDVDGWGEFYWGWATYGPWIVDGVRVGPLMFVGENLINWRVAAHEYGHMMGLPDLYDYDFDSKGCGSWCLMASGNGYMGAWCRKELGWVTPIAPGLDTYNVHFDPRSQNSDVWRIWDQGEWGPEYFLIEWIQKSGYDGGMPGEGLMIWHIDETQGGNNNENHKLCDVEEADGLDNLDKNQNNGDATDLWYDPNAIEFTDLTYPNSDSYDDGPTAVKVLNISDLTVAVADLIIGVPSNLPVDEIEPNDAFDDSGVIDILEPNGVFDGIVDYLGDPVDYWKIVVAEPSVITAELDSDKQGVGFDMTLYGPDGTSVVEESASTWPDETIRALCDIPGEYYLAVTAVRGAGYYNLTASLDALPDPGQVIMKNTPWLDSGIYDEALKIPAMRLDFFTGSGETLRDIRFYDQSTDLNAIRKIELWLDNGDDEFGPGLDTLVSESAGPGSLNTQVINGINQFIDRFATIWVVIDVGDTSDGILIGLSVPNYKDIVFDGGDVLYYNFPLDSGYATVTDAPMPLSYVAAGDFMMGSDPGNDPYYNPACDLNEETPYHLNRTGDFYISREEITNFQYSTFMDDLGYSTQSYWSNGGWSWKNNNSITGPAGWTDPGTFFIGPEWMDYPVGGLSWYECAAYCVYMGGRLPYEPEWEKSGRGTDGRIYPYGNVYNPALSALGNPEPVGTNPGSDSMYGVHDLSGNIFEWTYDAWEYGLYDRYAEGVLETPDGSNYRMQRGYRYLVVGSCGQSYATRLPYRDTWPRTYRWSITGFRVAFDPPA